MIKALAIILSLHFKLAYAQIICESSFLPEDFRFENNLADAQASRKIDYDKEIERLLSEDYTFSLKYNNLANGYVFRGSIDRIEDLPFEVSQFYRKDVKKVEMIRRFYDLDTKLQDSILSVYNTLNDKFYVKNYLKRLYAESYIYATEKNLVKDDGYIDGRAIVVTLIRRFKSRDDANFTKMIYPPKNGKHIITGKHNYDDLNPLNKNQAFRKAVATGPFIDGEFFGFVGHGAYSHMVQRDLVHESLKSVLGENTDDFYAYLGTTKGINFWVDLFDASSTNRISFSAPQDLTEVIRQSIIGPE
ncbi:MAG: hypothetical protein CMJ16_07145 [Peredibacter sp.]|nr:hypothetical protein [Peredibacter sp.]